MTKRARGLFHSKTCQCGNTKGGEGKPVVLLCSSCVKKLPKRLQKAMDLESVGALLHFYDEALVVISRTGNLADKVKT